MLEGSFTVSCINVVGGGGGGGKDGCFFFNVHSAVLTPLLRVWSQTASFVGPRHSTMSRAGMQWRKL